MKDNQPRKGVIFDVDGTLVDSNDAHTHAWIEAMQASGHEVPFDRVRPLIGMGGDKVLPEVLHISKDGEQGQQISQRRKEIFKQKYLGTLKSFPRTKELLERIHEQGLKMIIATSAEPEELEALLQIIGPGVDELFEDVTTAKDAPQSKPDPDIMHAAIERAHLAPYELVMLGDTPYDIDAAVQVAIDTIAFRTGGWDDKDLKKAIAIYDGPADLLAHYDQSPLSLSPSRS
jgi:HAD superfamily hydrolase (TIGR01549 family)